MPSTTMLSHGTTTAYVPTSNRSIELQLCHLPYTPDRSASGGLHTLPIDLLSPAYMPAYPLHWPVWGALPWAVPSGLSFNSQAQWVHTHRLGNLSGGPPCLALLRPTACLGMAAGYATYKATTHVITHMGRRARGY